MPRTTIFSTVLSRILVLFLSASCSRTKPPKFLHCAWAMACLSLTFFSASSLDTNNGSYGNDNKQTNTTTDASKKYCIRIWRKKKTYKFISSVNIKTLPLTVCDIRIARTLSLRSPCPAAGYYPENNSLYRRLQNIGLPFQLRSFRAMLDFCFSSGYFYCFISKTNHNRKSKESFLNRFKHGQ